MPNEVKDMSDRELEVNDLVLIPARVVGTRGNKWFNLQLVTASKSFSETSLCLNSKQVYLDSRPAPGEGT